MPPRAPPTSTASASSTGTLSWRTCCWTPTAACASATLAGAPSRRTTSAACAARLSWPRPRSRAGSGTPRRWTSGRSARASCSCSRATPSRARKTPGCRRRRRRTPGSSLRRCWPSTPTRGPRRRRAWSAACCGTPRRGRRPSWPRRQGPLRPRGPPRVWTTAGPRRNLIRSPRRRATCRRGASSSRACARPRRGCARGAARGARAGRARSPRLSRLALRASRRRRPAPRRRASRRAPARRTARRTPRRAPHRLHASRSRPVGGLSRSWPRRAAPESSRPQQGASLRWKLDPGLWASCPPCRRGPPRRRACTVGRAANSRPGGTASRAP
mmetsp:Transcript_17810/g.53608  ORF Transcript_17810/g.53608 Transcript_17810/m.53608 type:complete len:329 (+) Transcript_17810:465-1451(+)